MSTIVLPPPSLPRFRPALPFPLRWQTTPPIGMLRGARLVQVRNPQLVIPLPVAGNAPGAAAVAVAVAGLQHGDHEELESSTSSSSKSEWSTGVVIIGGGLAGLAAAAELAAAGRKDFVLVEASDGVGGRVRTDEYEGFLLDRGFQILITAYPEAQRLLDYEALQLRPFYAGALVWFDGRFHRVADPLRHPADGLFSLFNAIGSPLDKILVGLVRLRAAARADDAILSDPDETTILRRLTATGFSPAIINRFFRPFLGGIFFDRELQTTSRLFEFVLKCLALGSNTLPARGIGEIAQQLAGRLPEASIVLNCRATEVVKDGEGWSVGTADGRRLRARQGVIVAAEGPEARRLLGSGLPPITKPPRGTVCVYFEAEEEELPEIAREPVLLLNGTGKGLVNNMFFPAAVARTYAPAGKALVSVSVVGGVEEEEEVEEKVRRELSEWFGAGAVATWRHLRTYRIPLAQPDQSPPTELLGKPVRLGEGLYVCGDHEASATFDGALASGRRTAKALIADMAATPAAAL